MELRHLRAFLALAEERHQGRAAAKLGIEQPSLSRQIRELEQELDVQLFHRTSRSTWLSTAGESLMADARRIVADEQMVREAVVASWVGNRRLRLGLSEGLVSTPASNLLRHLETAPHDIRLILFERSLTDLAAMLATGAVDAIFSPEPSGSAEVDCLQAWSEPLALLLPTSHLDRPQSLRELALPLFLPDPMFLPGLTRQICEVLPATQNLAVSRFASVPALYALVGTGLGAGLLPKSLAAASDLVSVCALRTKRALFRVWMSTRRDDDTPAIAVLRAAIAAGVPMRIRRPSEE